ncbi:MAG: hypothetical protein K9W43_08645 [Candidatus Thorarchaeota archaeon]|nr:hypothetical protein [Candidatus Thorarchaeota archaeon]
MQEPAATPSVLAMIPDVLHTILTTAQKKSKGSEKQSLLLSSNALANRFILERWGIRPSQRKRYKNLFSSVRQHCRTLFEYYLARGQFIWSDGRQFHYWGVYKFDRIRGNLILGFVSIASDSPFLKKKLRESYL